VSGNLNTWSRSKGSAVVSGLRSEVNDLIHFATQNWSNSLFLQIKIHVFWAFVILVCVSFMLVPLLFLYIWIIKISLLTLHLFLLFLTCLTSWLNFCDIFYHRKCLTFWVRNLTNFLFDSHKKQILFLLTVDYDISPISIVKLIFF
jgi:hypothetical protein